MEVKFNVAAILKDKPKGTKLYDYLHNIDVEFNDVETTEIETSIWCTREKGGYNELFGYSKLGTLRGWLDGLQILLPSKEMRDWRKFDWKKGDILVSNDNDSHIIFKGFSKNDYTTFEGKYWISVSKKRYVSCLNAQNTQDYHIEDDKDAAQTYINTIEKRLGGKLNREILEVEESQPEFKDGDIVVYGKSVAICRKLYKHTLYFYVSIDETFGLLFDDNRVSSKEYRLATDSEKQQLFDALAKENKAWDAEKKQIVDIKKELQFKPFEKVLVRDSYDDMWRACFFSHIKEDDGRYVTTCFTWKFCIPYEGNEHLLGTTKDVED